MDSSWGISNPKRWCCESAALNMPANVEDSAVARGLKNVSFHPNRQKVNSKECANHHTIALISHASKLMLKILQARLQQYVKWKLSDVQAGFRKVRGTRDQIANICWIIQKAREFQNIFISDSMTILKALTVWVTYRLWKFFWRDRNTRPL